MADSEGQMKVGYWAIRGLAQPIRMALTLGDVSFKDVQYSCKSDGSGGWDTSAWFDVKPTLKIDFCNLPYVIDGDVSFSESIACLTYAAQKAGLHKEFSQAEEAKALAFAISVQDVRNTAVGHFYGTFDGADATKQYIATISKMFAKFSSVLEGKKWLMGDNICAADVHLCEMVFQNYMLAPEIFSGDNEILKSYAKNFFAMPKIAEMEKNCKLPCNNIMSKWGAEFIECDLTFGCEYNGRRDTLEC